MQGIDIYTRQFCGFCVMAKRLLDKKSVTYRELDATFKPELRTEMIQRAKGKTTFPQIFIGEHHVGGCDDLMALDQAGKLDALLQSAGAET